MHFTLHLSPRCNMHCGYCYSPPADGTAMTPEIGRRVLDMAAQTGEKSCGIIFFGGEPLLHRDLIYDLVDYGEAHPTGQRYHFKVTTNGVLLDEAFLAYSLRHHMLVAMSFDGIREAHDAHRRFPDGRPTFEYLLPRLQLLLAARPYSSVYTVVNPDTARYLAESVAFLAELGARYLIVSLNYAAPWDEASFAVLARQCEKLGDLYIQWTRANRKFYLSPLEVKLSSHINRDCYHQDRCELAQRQLSVDHEGDLYPCVQFVRAGREGGWCIGNVFDGIDESARQRIRAASSQEKEFCADCAVKGRCNNTCGCLNWQTTGTVNAVSPVLCRYEQMLMKVADRVGKKLYRERNALFLHKHYNAAYPVLSLLEDATGPAGPVSSPRV